MSLHSTLLDELVYWKQRCELAEECLEASLCDTDSTPEQIACHSAWEQMRNTPPPTMWD